MAPATFVTNMPKPTANWDSSESNGRLLYSHPVFHTKWGVSELNKAMFLTATCILALTACGAASSSFEAKGTMTLGLDGVTQHAPGGGECDGYGGYDDITPGAQVVISAEGKTVGKGELGEGKYDDGWCKFPFTVSDVKGGFDFYSVEVSGRGTIEYTREELEAGVGLSLGS